MSWPGGVSELKVVLSIAAMAAIPTVAWGVLGASYVSDDYWIAYWLDDLGLVEGMQRIAFESPARPLAAPYYALIYAGIGQQPALHVLLLAAVNVGMILATWRFGRHFLRPDVLLIALAVFAVLPNRASTRLWFVVGSYPLAVTLVMLGGTCLLCRRFVVGSVAMVGAVLLYEGVAGLAVVVLSLVAWRHRAEIRRLLLAAVPVLLSVLLMYLMSPKRRGAGAGSFQGPFDEAETLAPAHFASGVAQHPVAGLVLYAVVAIMVVWAVVRVLPSFRVDGSELHLVVLVGLAVTVVAAGPMLVGGSQFAVEGLNDRNNLVPSIGSALVLAVPLVMLIRRRRVVALTAIPAVLVTLLVFSVRDIDSYRSAQGDGRRVVRAIEYSVAAPQAGEVVIVPAFDPEDGVARFVYNVDIQGAMHLRTGEDWSFLRMAMAYDCGTARAGARFLNWHTGYLTDGASSDVAARKECRERR